MERFTRTPFFLLLAGQNGEATTAKNVESASAYTEFTHQVTRLCLEDTGEIPAFFILNYTRIELDQLQTNAAEVEKKLLAHSLPA